MRIWNRFWSRIALNGFLAVSLLAVAYACVLAKQSVSLVFDVSCERILDLTVYYTAESGVYFSEEQTATASIAEGDSHVEVRLPTPAVKRLRIDFDGPPGRLTIRNPVLRGRHVVPLDCATFVPSSDIDGVEASCGTTLDVSFGDGDPFITYAGDLDVKSPDTGSFRSILGFLRPELMSLVFVLLVALVQVNLHRAETEGDATPFSRLPVRPDSSSFLKSLGSLFVQIWSDRAFVAYMVAVVLIGWGFELANCTITVDDEIILFHPATITWVRQGRWGMCLSALLFGNVSAPVVPLLITLVLYSVSFCIFFAGSGREKYFLFPIYVAFPTLFQSFSFNSLNPGIGIAFLCAALAAKCVFSRGIASIVIGVLLGSVALGIYQVFLLFLAAGIAFLWMKSIAEHSFFLRWRALVRDGTRTTAVVLGSICLYNGIQWGSKWFLGISQDDFVSRNYIRPIENADQWRQWFFTEIWKIHEFLAGSTWFYPEHMAAFGALMVFVLSVLPLLVVFGRRQVVVKILQILGFVFLLCVPFLPDTLNNASGIPTRVITVVLPLSLVSLVYFSLRETRAFPMFRAVLLALSAVAGLQCLWCLNLETYSVLLQNRYDASFANELRTRIDELPDVSELKASGRGIPLTIVGICKWDVFTGPHKGKNWPDWESENIGNSCFAETARFASVLRLCTGERFDYRPIETCSQEILRHAESMPMWPLKGSVSCLEGVVIVKFTDRYDLVGRKLMYKEQPKNPVNGFDELVYTEIPEENCLFSYTDGDLQREPFDVVRLSDLSFELTGTAPQIAMKPFSDGANPYVVLELSVFFDRADSLELWNDIPAQHCRFQFYTGDNVLKLRVPVRFLAKGITIRPGGGSVRRFTIKSLKVYADRAYTERLCELNPGMRETLARQMEERN